MTLAVAARPAVAASAALAALAALASLLLGAPWALAQPGGRPQVQLHCLAWGTGPMLECTADIRQRDGSPLQDAQVTLGALMPSMPMAHTVKPVQARATGKPGQYRGTLELEMLGVWSVEVDIRGPARDKSAHSLMVPECPDRQRCPATPARGGHKAAAHRH